MARVNFHQYTYDSDSAYDYGGTGIPSTYTVNYDWARSRWIGAEAQGTKGFKGIQLTTGAELREYFQERYQNEDRSPAVINTSIDRRDFTWGVFANGEIPLYRTYLTLDAGVRYDAFSSFDSAVNPRAALIGRPFAKTALKAIYGQAYRAPNVYEANFSGPGSVANPSLRPETIRTYEAVWEQQHNAYVRTSVSAYLNRIDGLIAREAMPGTGLIHVANLGRVDGRGVEVEVEGRHPETGFRGRMSYALQEAMDTVADRPLSNSPRHLAKFNVVVPLRPNSVFASLELRYQSEVGTVYATTGGSFWLVNATFVSQQIRRGLDLSVSAYNLLDKPIALPGGPEHSMAWIPQPGRRIQAKLTFGF